MTENEIFQIVKHNVTQILPDLAPDKITIEKRLKDLGANSIDRLEIVTLTMEALQLRCAMVELGKLNDIKGLVAFLHEKKLSSHGAVK